MSVRVVRLSERKASPLLPTPSPSSPSKLKAASPPFSPVSNTTVFSVDMQNCITRIEEVVKLRLNASGTKYKCHFARDRVETGRIVTLFSHCGHQSITMNESVKILAEIKMTSVETVSASCKKCGKSSEVLVPIFEASIPIFSYFQTKNDALVAEYLSEARLCMKEKAFELALHTYHRAFLYTNQAEHYADVPICYEKLGRRSEAVLSYLFFCLYLLEEKKVAEAIASLERCKEIDPTLKNIDPILADLRVWLEKHLQRLQI